MHKKGKCLKRAENTKSLKGNVYIFCEGKKTECKYFSTFRSQVCKGRKVRKKPPQIKVIPSNNCGAPSNIKFINSYAESQSLSDKDGDCMICVIDCDSNTSQDLDKAIKMASGRTDDCKIKVDICLSNPSFEVWYLLHYEILKERLDQKTLENKLRDYIKDYKKNVDYYSFLEDKKNNAIKNAHYLKEYHSKRDVELLSIESNPSTMVPYLLEYIESFIQEV